MRFFLDQSGKWEESGPTAIGISDEKRFELSLFVDAETKRAVNRYLRSTYQEKNKSKTAFQVRCFAYLVFLALRKTLRENDELVIDLEYEGHEQRIREMLTRLFQTHERRRIRPDQILFQQVGKAALCHKVAQNAFRNRNADKQIGFDELITLIQPV